ncbi:MAG: peptide chain release factor N(5)-glutamine methyltransferase [Halofilum sp. (in: g-proteobacteria)]|nr:peptide chain release factor N(5)-glutamine methyltransferase [Halofilum sp. (in: g-proteobacteria)]
MTLTVDRALRDARLRLTESPTAALDAELLLAHALERRRTWLRAWPEAVLPDDRRERFEALLARREAGEPVAYLLGWREFWSLEFEVGPGVLIPRPETEALVWCVLQTLPAPATRPLEVLDLGTGSGCIALTLAQVRPDLRVTAVEASREALEVARRNAARHGMRNVTFVEGEWFGPVAGRRFDLVVSNPPYIASGDPHLRSGDVRFEPAAALDGGPDGLDALRAIAARAPQHLLPGGVLAVEHGHDQRDAVAALFTQAGLCDVTGYSDDSGHPRVATGRAPRLGE